MEPPLGTEFESDSVATVGHVNKKGGPRLGVLAGSAGLAIVVGLVAFGGWFGGGSEQDAATATEITRPGATADETQLDGADAESVDSSSLRTNDGRTATTEVGHSSGHSVRQPLLSVPVTIRPQLPSDVELGLLFLSDSVRSSTFLPLNDREPQDIAANGKYLAGAGSKVALTGSNGIGKVLFSLDLAADPVEQDQLVVRNEFSFDSVDIENGYASFMDRTAWNQVNYDLSNGRELSRSPVPAGLSYQVAIGPGSELRNGEQGGVYWRRPTGMFSKFHEGAVVVSDQNTLLIRTCDESVACTDDWYDRRTFQPLQYPPLVDEELLRLTGERWAVAPTSVRDITTGKNLNVTSELAPSAGASPDGRWVAVFDSADKDVVKLFDTAPYDQYVGLGPEPSQLEPVVYTVNLGANYWSDRIAVVDLAG